MMLEKIESDKGCKIYPQAMAIVETVFPISETESEKIVLPLEVKFKLTFCGCYIAWCIM